MNFNENGKGMTRIISPNKDCKKREKLGSVSHFDEYLAGELEILWSPRPPNSCSLFSKTMKSSSRVSEWIEAIELQQSTTWILVSSVKEKKGEHMNINIFLENDRILIFLLITYGIQIFFFSLYLQGSLKAESHY